MSGSLSRDLSVLRRAYDVIVIGGGITGVNVARECAGRGWRTLMLERGDLGNATSSATTKYLHGGLRYLEQGDLPVVFESIKERRTFALAAPHLVRPRRFILPAWEWASPGPALLGAGIGIYEAMAVGRNVGVDRSLRVPTARWLSPAQVIAAAPWLSPAGLRGGFAYYDMLNVHPERLLLAVAHSAVEQGAAIVTYCDVIDVLTSPDAKAVPQVTGVLARDVETGDVYEVAGTCIVNASGAWADAALGRLGPRAGLEVRRVKGVHLLTRPLGGRDAVFTRSPDGGHLVVSPWMGHSFIGPTETALDGTPESAGIDADDVRHIVQTVSAVAREPLDPRAVVGATVGVRPLVRDPGRSSYSNSRRFRIVDHAGHGAVGAWSIAGGKWTTGRKVGAAMAARLTRSGRLPRPMPFDSRRMPVAGAFPGPGPIEESIRDAAHRGPTAVPARTRRYLARLYGTNAWAVMGLVDENPELARPISDNSERLDIGAQVAYAVTHEGARTLGDVLDRRLVLGTVGRVTPRELTAVAQIAGPLWGWDAARIDAEVERELGHRARRMAAVFGLDPATTRLTPPVPTP